MATKKKVTATIDIKELLYDIMNETYLRGRTIQNGENHKEVASMYASEDDENLDKLLRSIKKGFAEVKTELAEYLDEDGTTTDNSRYDGKSDLELNLSEEHRHCGVVHGDQQGRRGAVCGTGAEEPCEHTASRKQAEPPETSHRIKNMAYELLCGE